MNDPEVVFDGHWSELIPSEGNKNSVINIKVKTYKIVEDPSTSSRTITDQSTQFFPPVQMDLNLQSCSQEYIQSFFQNQLVTDHDWLHQALASYISTGLTCLGDSPNGFILTITVKITYRTFEEAISVKMVLKGRLDKEEVMKMVENESCSICLDNLSDSSKHGDLTRMTCSHVFHDDCLLKWLHKSNTCPLCRTVLYDP